MGFKWGDVLCTVQVIGTHSIHYSQMCVLVAQSCLSLCNPVDCSSPGSSVHGIFQARILEWVAFPFSRGSSQPRDWTQVFIAGRFFTVWVTREALMINRNIWMISGVWDSPLLQSKQQSTPRLVSIRTLSWAGLRPPDVWARARVVTGAPWVSSKQTTPLLSPQGPYCAVVTQTTTEAPGPHLQRISYRQQDGNLWGSWWRPNTHSLSWHNRRFPWPSEWHPLPGCRFFLIYSALGPHRRQRKNTTNIIPGSLLFCTLTCCLCWSFWLVWGG